VYFAFVSGGTATVTDGAETLAVDEAVPPLTNAKYTVRAICALGQSSPSASNTGWRNREAPANVAASDGQYPDKVRITWLGVPNATKYRVYRQLGAEDPVAIGTVNGTLLSFYDTTISVGVTGTYFVQALHSLGATALSEPDDGFREVLLAFGGPADGAKPLPGATPPADADGDSGAQQPGGGTGESTGENAGDDASEVADEPEADCAACALCDETVVRLDALVEMLATHETSDGALLESLAALVVPSDDGSIPACAMREGDVDLDGDIDADDLASFLEAWSSGDLVRGDLNRDGVVDGEDFLWAALAIGSAQEP
jgi:hypothetical protein